MDKKFINSLKIGIVNVINNPTVRIVCRLAGDTADAVKVFETRNPWSYFACAAKLAVSLVDNLEVDEYMYFEANKSWTCPFSQNFSSLIKDAVSDFPMKTIKTSDKGIDIRLVDIGNDIRIGWTMRPGISGGLSQVWSPAGRLADTRQQLTEILWKKFGGESIVMGRSTVNSYRPRDEESSDIVHFTVDSSLQFMTSKMAKEQAEYLRRCMSYGIKRSILYYGPPGTGKTTMVQTVVKALGLRSFRFAVGDVGVSSTSTINDALDIFKPDVVIIDDIDRVHEYSNMNDFMTNLKERTKFVLATANKPSELDESVLRPGRFDELVAVTHLDDDVTRFILGTDYIDAFNDVKDFPIAYIQEYRTQRLLHSHEKATQILTELQNRVRRLSSYYNELDVSDDGTTGIAPVRPKKNDHVGSPIPEED